MSFEIFNFLRSMKQSILNETEDLHTQFIGKIIDVDNVKRKCSVMLLQKVVKTVEGEALQNISQDLIDVPMPSIFDSKYWLISASYEIGDKVEIQVSERPIAEALMQEEIGEQQKFSRMQIEYSIIQRAISSNIYEEDNIDPENLIMMNKNTGDYIKLLKGGGIELKGDVIINGKLTVSGTSTAEDHLSGSISGKDHTHGGVQSGSSQTGTPE